MEDRRRQKAYIAGGISKVKNYVSLFNEAETFLQVLGYSVFNPVEIGKNLELTLNSRPSYQDFMKEDLKALLKCDVIFMLPNWRQSTGARFERAIAKIAGIEIRYLPK